MEDKCGPSLVPLLNQKCKEGEHYVLENLLTPCDPLKRRQLKLNVGNFLKIYTIQFKPYNPNQLEFPWQTSFKEEYIAFTMILTT